MYVAPENKSLFLENFTANRASTQYDFVKKTNSQTHCSFPIQHREVPNSAHLIYYASSLILKYISYKVKRRFTFKRRFADTHTKKS